MNQRSVQIRKYSLHAAPDVPPQRTPAECISLMWQLAQDAWAFKGEPVAEPGLSRHVVRVIRRRRIDILTSIDGLTFDEAWANRKAIPLEGATSFTLSRLDLVRNKRAAGGLKDLSDVAWLEDQQRGPS